MAKRAINTQKLLKDNAKGNLGRFWQLMAERAKDIADQLTDDECQLILAGTGTIEERLWPPSLGSLPTISWQPIAAPNNPNGAWAKALKAAVENLYE